MEILHGAPLPKTIPAPAPKVESKKLLLPERNDNANAVIRYLKGRGIHDVIIRFCMENDLLFESRKYHSAVFLGYDKEGVAKQEVEKPFPREEELKEKPARLDQLNILLNMDKREKEIVDGVQDEGEIQPQRESRGWDR